MNNQSIYLNMPVAHFGNVLSWDKETIDDLVMKAVGLATRVGLRLDDDNEGLYLKELEAKGTKIDWSDKAVIFRQSDIEKTMAVMRDTRPIPNPLRPLATSQDGRNEKYLVGNGANLLFDWDTWTAVAPSIEEVIDLCRWAQGCDQVDALFPPVMLKDVDQRISPIYNYVLMGKYCRKTIYHEQATEPIHVRYLEKMARVVERRRDFFQPMKEMEYINPPFRIGFRAIATMLERVDSGACSLMGVGSMAVSGMSAPVTIAGTAVTALAEILAGLTLFRILRPGYGLRASACTGSLDMRNARVSYFGMHTHLCNLATWDLLVRGIGTDAQLLTWYRDANEPGLQAIYEFGMSQAFFSSIIARSSPEIGGLACGNIFSPHQAMLDMQAYREFNELLGGFDISEEALNIDGTAEARFHQGVHMSTEHTLAHMMDGVPSSSYFQRGLPAGAYHNIGHTQSQELMERAATDVEKAKSLGYEVEPDEELAAELYEFVKEAAAELKIDSPPLP